MHRMTCPGGAGEGGRWGVGGGGGDATAGGGGDRGARGPQSKQSVPNVQEVHSEPRPPSSHVPSERYKHVFAQSPPAA